MCLKLRESRNVLHEMQVKHCGFDGETSLHDVVDKMRMSLGSSQLAV